MYELKKKIGKVFTSKFVGTGPSSYEKGIYRTAVSQMLRNTGVETKRVAVAVVVVSVGMCHLLAPVRQWLLSRSEIHRAFVFRADLRTNSYYTALTFKNLASYI